MTAWLHSHINNQSSYNLTLVDKRVFGSRNYQWQRPANEPPKEPPANVPAKTAIRGAWTVWADDLIGAMVGCDVTYEADVDGFKLRIVLTADAADTTSGAIPPQFQVSKPDIVNVYYNRDSSHREINVNWTIRDWPD
jgi:hypothetical protein